MAIRFDRIEKAQALMRREGWVGLMIMNHDDYRYFFGRDWAQPRAIIPAEGQPILVAFAAEAPEVRDYAGDAGVEVFTHVGEQMADVTGAFRQLLRAAEGAPDGAKARVGMQMWFGTPAFLVDLFRKINPRLEVVPSDPVMDALRMVKEPEEIEHMVEAQRIAGLGMDRVWEMLRPSVTARQVAAEAQCVMLKAGAEGMSTPVYANFGIYSCMLHGGLSPAPLRQGDLAVINLNPQVEGYAANLSRTFVVGPPDDTQRRLHDAYLEMVAETRQMLVPGVAVKDLDARGREVCAAHGLGDYHLDGIAHGIGLRFEETPASTIIKQHRHVTLKEGMTMTIGHTILAVPGVGGVRHEDVYRVTPAGGEVLHAYESEWLLPAET